MPTRLSDVEALPWRGFLERMRDTWEPGEHWALIAPTGERKTTFAGGLALTRKYVLALDQKGGDKTLGLLENHHGWERRTEWPLPYRDRKMLQRCEPVRRVIGGTRRDARSRYERWTLCRKVLEAVMNEGRWTVLAPDLKALTAKEFGAAWTEMVQLLILARDSGASIISDFHGPRGIPPEAAENATYMGIGYYRDRDTVSDLAQSMGRQPAEIRGAVAGLHDLPGSWLVVSRRPRDPLLLTAPEKL